MTAQTLLFRSTIWVGLPTQKDLNKIQCAEIKFLRNVKGCSIWDKNDEITKKKIEIESITN